MALNRSFILNDGSRIPAVGFGTWQAAPKEVEQATETALRVGYRHIDCAAIYQNEKEVGEGIRNSGVKRGDIFLTTKLWNTKHAPEDVESALDQSLSDLGTSYVDLYLMHWPVAFAAGKKLFPLDSRGVFQLADIDPVTTWKAMERLVETGKAKAIGVSNFNMRRIEALLPHCNIVPAVNQIEAHPYLQQRGLVDFCKAHRIHIAAYSPLGNNQTGEPRTVDDVKVYEIAKRLNLDPGQVLVSWGAQRGTCVLPKSVTKSRIESNFKDSVLPADVMAELGALERHKRFNFPARWGFDIFDEMGVEAVRREAMRTAEENKTKFTA